MRSERPNEKITKRAVDAAKPRDATYKIWDSELKGFGLKIAPGGVKTYFVWYRAGSGRSAPRREYTIGRHGHLTPDEARLEATAALRSVALGDDPQARRQHGRREMTVSQLCTLYFDEGVATKKSSTIRTDKARIKAHVEPLLGSRQISTVATLDIERFMRDVANGKTAAIVKPTLKALKGKGVQVHEDTERLRRGDAVAKGGKGAATRTTGLLGGIFSFAVRRKLIEVNPVKAVERYKDKKSQRFLSSQELNRLSIALDEVAHNGSNEQAVFIIKLLLLTGARKSEIERLLWAEVDFEWSCLRLGDSKVGGRVVHIGTAAMQLLSSVPRSRSSFVFPSSAAAALGSDLPYGGTSKLWERQVRARAGLQNVRLHDLRHTYASLAVAGGQSLQIIGALLGHRDVKTTAQYAHLADDPVRAAADRTAAAATAAMAGLSADVVALHRR